MAVPQSHFIYTEEEYLAMEREAEERHIYLDGYTWAMAGESPDHGEISTNLTRITSTQLLNSTCRIRSGNTRVRSGPVLRSKRSRKGLYSYPDVLIVCGEMQFHDQYRDVLTNPTAIIEILSDSTEQFDRGEKFQRYQRWNPTLSDYLLIAQNKPTIEHFRRQPDDSWTYQIHHGLDAAFTITSVNCTLTLAEVYRLVEFPPEVLEELAASEEA